MRKKKAIVYKLQYAQLYSELYSTYYIRGIAVLDLQEIHRPDHRLHRHENVLVYEFDKPSFVFVRVTGAVDDPHLLNEGGLAGLTSTCDKVSGSIGFAVRINGRLDLA